MTWHTRWEYRQAHLSRAGVDTERHLHTLGADGWELVAIDPDGLWVFKRPAPLPVLMITPGCYGSGERADGRPD